MKNMQMMLTYTYIIGDDKMPVYKNKENGTWYCKFYYKDWQGARRQKWKRGFPTKRKAQKFNRNSIDCRRFLCKIFKRIMDNENNLKIMLHFSIYRGRINSSVICIAGKAYL